MANSSVSASDPRVWLFVSNAESPGESLQLDFACRWYGLRLVRCLAATASDLDACARTEGLPVVAVLPASSVAELSSVAGTTLRQYLAQHAIPLAVIGIDAGSDCARLADWLSLTHLEARRAAGSAAVWTTATAADEPGFELRNIRFNLTRGNPQLLALPAGPEIRVLTVGGTDAASAAPVLAEVRTSGASVFLLSRVAPEAAATPWQFHRTHFGEVLPLMLLLHATTGERRWHAPIPLANFTIDDPWLVEPYGCLSYPGLLGEMQRERFHTTIGFVPWNFDRSKPQVVEFFRQHPEHFSLAVHGNNHDRYEFYRYAPEPGDVQRSKPLDQQQRAVQQAAARVAAFQGLTGLTVDPVMVFPHGISPALTLRELKRCGFIATSNYSNVPLGEAPPADPAEALRSPLTAWEGFPTLRRLYPKDYSEEAVAVDLFLGNPVQFMAHQDLFFTGIDAFTPYARLVNDRQPGIRWTSLGEMTWFMHLLRWRDETHAEVRMRSSRARITNSHRHAAEFACAKSEPFPENVEQVLLNGVDVPWHAGRGGVRFDLTIAAGAEARVEICYRGRPALDHVDLRRSGWRNRVLRAVADFRDLVLPRNPVGRLLTSKYYSGKKRPTLRSLLTRLRGRG